VSAWGYVPILLGLLTFLVGGRLGRRLPPAAIVRVGTVLALSIATMTGVVLAVAALLSVRILQAAARGGHSANGLVPGFPPAVGAVAAVVVFLLLASAARCFLRSARDLMRASAKSRRLGPIHAGLVVVDDDVPTAFAVAGAPGRVVVSTAMLAALDADERQVLLAHESAHLRHHHHVYVQLARLWAAANPLLRPLARAVAANTERWADEVAAAEVGNRRLVARGLARAALARREHARSFAQPPVPSATLAVADGQLVERIDRLLEPPPRRARLVCAAVLSVAILCSVTGMASVVQVHRQIERLELVGAPLPR
jgi:beta-lactamase regulating signal transducer with metallopeptidase domain